MKILDVSPISSTIAMPVKSGTLQFIQDAYKEGISTLVYNLVGGVPSVNTIYILSGCINTGTAPNYIISAGKVYVNGEIYDVDAVTFTLVGLEKAYAYIDITQFTTNADPVEFTDGIFRNVHNIRKIKIVNTLISGGLPEFQDFIRLGAFLTGDIKEIDCTNAYITANFDGTGLGIKERLGWAICNGNNGTKNRNGRVSLAYGTSYTTMGVAAGEETHTLASNEQGTFDVKGKIDDFNGGTNVGMAVMNFNGVDTPRNGGADQSTYGTTITVPLSAATNAHNNMQPYIVTLFIQKI